MFSNELHADASGNELTAMFSATRTVMPMANISRPTHSLSTHTQLSALISTWLIAIAS